MSSRNMHLLPRATLHSDSEQYSLERPAGMERYSASYIWFEWQSTGASETLSGWESLEGRRSRTYLEDPSSKKNLSGGKPPGGKYTLKKSDHY